MVSTRLGELEQTIKNKEMPALAKDKALKEFKKLRSMPPMSAETTVVRNYIDCIVNLPWDKKSKSKIDINKAEKILDEDHFGLAKPKERILEYLAVQSQVKKIKGPILCLVGPPGVGKTSICQSIARAMGRKFARLSLGGVRDEAEIRGHRRTYIGAMPGKIIQSMQKVDVANPVFCLDEVDKMSMDFRGDPLPPCSKFSIRSRMSPSMIIISTSITISPRCFLLPPPTICTASPFPCRIGWRSSRSMAIPRKTN